MSIDIEAVKRRIELSREMPLDERAFVLKAVKNYAAIYSAKRNYPSRHGPGSTQWATMAWMLIDNIAEGTPLEGSARTLLAGLIAGALSETDKIARGK